MSFLFSPFIVMQSAKHVTELPCARNSLLSGIASGVGVGVIRGLSVGMSVGAFVNGSYSKICNRANGGRPLGRWHRRSYFVSIVVG